MRTSPPRGRVFELPAASLRSSLRLLALWFVGSALGQEETPNRHLPIIARHNARSDHGGIHFSPLPLNLILTQGLCHGIYSPCAAHERTARPAFGGGFSTRRQSIRPLSIRVLPPCRFRREMAAKSLSRQVSDQQLQKGLVCLPFLRRQRGRLRHLAIPFTSRPPFQAHFLFPNKTATASEEW